MGNKVLFFIFFLCVYYSTAEYVTTLGDCTNYKLIGRDRVYEKARKNEINTKVIKFPKVRNLYYKITENKQFM